MYEFIKDITPIKELSHKTLNSYRISSFEEVLLPIIKENQVLLVSGGYFGDEGKGKTTHAIANSGLVDIVVRWNSGENAGHTVMHEGKKYVFHLTPSGITIPDVKCAIGSECVMDPMSYLQKEVNQLIKGGIDYKERLFVGNVQITGPHHKILDFALKPINSSTLMGISDVHESKVGKKGLRLDHVYGSTDIQANRLRKELDVYNAKIRYAKLDDKAILEKFGDKPIQEHVQQFLLEKDKVDYLIELYGENIVNNPQFPTRTNVNHMIRRALKDGRKVLGECAQSLFLSNAVETHWESATSAHTHAYGTAASGVYNLGRHKTAVINVLKTPGDSRVGAGANPSSFVKQTYFSDKGIDSFDNIGEVCIDYDTIQKLYFESVQENGILKPVVYRDSTGEYLINEAMAISSARKFEEKGATSGKPRVTGVFDCLTASMLNEVQGPYLSISCIDRANSHDYVGLTVGYIYHSKEGSAESNGIVYNNGDLIRIGDPLPNSHVLKDCHKIQKVMKGLKDDPIRDGYIPEVAQNIIGTIEDLTGLKVISYGIGPESDQVNYIIKN